ncbi:hypothetical protein ACJQWK_04440 [Exserohilum turcicum]
MTHYINIYFAKSDQHGLLRVFRDSGSSWTWRSLCYLIRGGMHSQGFRLICLLSNPCYTAARRTLPAPRNSNNADHSPPQTPSSPVALQKTTPTTIFRNPLVTQSHAQQHQ